jgi:alpha-D-xyloside xylohydrolase
MFGKDLLVAPVVESGVERSEVYLPNTVGGWYDFWTEQHLKGGKSIETDSPIDKIPLFVAAGSILPLGPTKQYVSQKPDNPIELRIYPGKDATFTLYEDEGTNYNYEKGQFSTIPLKWHDRSGQLEIGNRAGSFPSMLTKRTFSIHLAGRSSTPRTLAYGGAEVLVNLK